jgi:DNA mismatch repair protein MLH1
MRWSWWYSDYSQLPFLGLKAQMAKCDLQVEDLFYNIPTRRRAFRSASEEYAKILDVVGRYAVHCSGVAFSTKKHGDAGSGISVQASASTVDRIKQIHGSGVGNELIEFSVKDKKWGFEASGWTTNANYHVKRTTILLFINHRSVESSAIRKAIEQTYSMFLPKGGHPFVYLSLEVEPSRVDVNVHPTKREVHFLNEDEIIELVCDEIKTKLAKVDTSRTFFAQTLLPGANIPTIQTPSRTETLSESPQLGSRSTEPKSAASSKKPYENNLVRTDAKMRKITSMLPSAVTDGSPVQVATGGTMEGMTYETVDREPVQIRLTSIKTLRSDVRDAMHEGLTELFASHTYVGLVDERRRLCAIQAGVKLFLVDYGLISNEFFYQVGLTDFGNFGRIVLDPAPKLMDILRLGAEAEVENAKRETSDEDFELNAVKIAAGVHKQLLSRREMLLEYFSLDISEEGFLLSLPLLLKGYLPSLAKLPRFLIRLGPFVNWTDEQACFQTFLTELAAFYVPEQLPTTGKATAGSEAVEDEVNKRRKQVSWSLEHVIFPAIRGRLVGTQGMLKGVVEVANLKGLYRVFERC